MPIMKAVLAFFSSFLPVPHSLDYMASATETEKVSTETGNQSVSETNISLGTVRNGTIVKNPLSSRNYTRSLGWKGLLNY